MFKHESCLLNPTYILKSVKECGALCPFALPADFPFWTYSRPTIHLWSGEKRYWLLLNRHPDDTF